MGIAANMKEKWRNVALVAGLLKVWAVEDHRRAEEDQRQAAEDRLWKESVEGKGKTSRKVQGLVGKGGGRVGGVEWSQWTRVEWRGQGS